MNGTKIYISDITSKDPGSAKITTADGREYYLSKDSGPKVIDSTGNVLHMPPGEVLDALGGAKPTLDWSSYSDSYISTVSAHQRRLTRGAGSAGCRRLRRSR